MKNKLKLAKILMRGIKNKIKEIEPEAYLRTDNNLQEHLVKSLNDIKKESEIYSKESLKEVSKVENPEPIVSSNKPFEINFPKLGEKYSWCTCGLSQRQPFCDGRHKGTGFKPMRFSIEEPVATVYVCCCKKTTTPPLCDLETCKCL